MGIVEFFLFTFAVLVLAGLTTWALDYFVPAHPAIANHLICGVAIVVVIAMLAQAVGLLRYDPIIPRIR